MQELLIFLVLAVILAVSIILHRRRNQHIRHFSHDLHYGRIFLEAWYHTVTVEMAGNGEQKVVLAIVPPPRKSEFEYFQAQFREAFESRIAKIWEIPGWFCVEMRFANYRELETVVNQEGPFEYESRSPDSYYPSDDRLVIAEMLRSLSRQTA